MHSFVSVSCLGQKLHHIVLVVAMVVARVVARNVVARWWPIRVVWENELFCLCKLFRTKVTPHTKSVLRFFWSEFAVQG